MAARSYPCWWCNEPFDTPLAHSIHVTNCPQRSSGGITREVHCPACAEPIDLRYHVACQACGRTYRSGS